MYCVKKESPLLLGLGEGCNYVGSDLNAFLEYTRKAVVLDDGEYVVLGRNDYKIRKLKIREQHVEKNVLHIDWDVETSKKGGYSHYMLKEIFDEPQTIRQALKIPQEQISGLAMMFAEAPHVYLMGLGTTYYVANISQYYFSTFADALKVGRACDEAGFYWIEDLYYLGGGTSNSAHEKLREFLDTPLLQGEKVAGIPAKVNMLVSGATDFIRGNVHGDGTVSYTHLTLPTSDLV